MNGFPETSIVGESGFAPQTAGICDFCGQIGIIMKRGRNTSYEDHESNILESCELCWEYDNDIWTERWAEYNSGRL
jgi:ssDNA-binding Zn-finger/Zn-ribbon topoisomerase 1